jgi:hypothetical protein
MRSLILAAFLVAGCATFSQPSPPPSSNALSGMWRAESGQTLSISLFSTFATQHGCAITGGTLEPMGDGAYRIGRYETGFSSDTCGPWRSGPEIAPFDGVQVRLFREGDRLVAQGQERRVTFRWIGPSSV